MIKYFFCRTAIAAGLLISSSIGYASETLDHILFGSCAHQDNPLPILDSIIADNPDLFVFLGDNVYGDTENMATLKAKYEKLGSNPRFKKLRKQVPTMAIWDDHDYGENDAGKAYPQKAASRQIMLDFWQEPQDSVRRTRSSGIYTSREFNSAQQRIQVILPDLRWNRDELNEVSTITYFSQRRPNNLGPYALSENPNASMLGEEQWQWLEAELLKPAKLKIIGSSLQVLADFTGWEAWANFPADLQRLKHFIKANKINGVVLVSGDTHWGEFSYFADGLDYPLWEMTSSGLSEEWKDVSPNKNRIGQYTHQVNYGAISIDWAQNDPLITMSLKDINGNPVSQHSFRLSSISPY